LGRLMGTVYVRLSGPIGDLVVAYKASGMLLNSAYIAAE
jgi:hypothetical protein